MKVELDIADPIVELMQAFKQIADKVIDKDDVEEHGIDIDDLNNPEKLDGIANVLLYAGLKHFKDQIEKQVNPITILEKFLEEKLGLSKSDTDDNDESPIGIGRMVIGSDGVELSGDLPEGLREALMGVGESLRDAMGADGKDDCDCPNCQFRRAHSPKGKFS